MRARVRVRVRVRPVILTLTLTLTLTVTLTCSRLLRGNTAPYISRISPPFLAHISLLSRPYPHPISREAAAREHRALYLPYLSPISRPYLAPISPLSPPYLPRGCCAGTPRPSSTGTRTSSKGDRYLRWPSPTSRCGADGSLVITPAYVSWLPPPSQRVSCLPPPSQHVSWLHPSQHVSWLTPPRSTLAGYLPSQHVSWLPPLAGDPRGGRRVSATRC